MSSLAAALRIGQNYRTGARHLSLLVLMAAIVLVAYSSNLFLSIANLSNLSSQIAPLLIASLGQTLVILTGGLDISNGAVIGLVTGLLVLDAPQWEAVTLAIGAAGVIGLVNGIGIAYFEVHPIIMTLSTMSFVQGLALIVIPVPGGVVPSWITACVVGDVAGIPLSLFWILGWSAFGGWILYRTRFGLHLFSIGGNATNARLNGVNTQRCVVAVYMLSALFAAAAGVFLAGRIASGDANVGATYGLDTITAVALGGTQLSGGIGSLGGTIIGTVLVGVMANGMNLTNVSAFLQTVLKGVLLLAVVCVQRRKEIGL
jgi:ribose transport system permease protein